MSAPVGSLAAEVALLLDAFAVRLAAARPAGAGGAESDGAAGAAEPAGAGGAESDGAAGGAEPAGADAGAGRADDGAISGAGRAEDWVDGAPTGHAETEGAGREQATGSAQQGPCGHCGHDPARPVVCTSCPVCALIAVLRGERPETTARLVDGALAVVQSLRALLPAIPAPADNGSDADESAGRDPATRNAGVRDPTAHRIAEATPHLERIDIG